MSCSDQKRSETVTLKKENPVELTLSITVLMQQKSLSSGDKQ
jgi:hypothetical protein